MPTLCASWIRVEPRKTRVAEHDDSIWKRQRGAHWSGPQTLSSTSAAQHFPYGGRTAKLVHSNALLYAKSGNAPDPPARPELLQLSRGRNIPRMVWLHSIATCCVRIIAGDGRRGWKGRWFWANVQMGKDGLLVDPPQADWRSPTDRSGWMIQWMRLQAKCSI